jgi:hypothetical protein
MSGFDTNWTKDELNAYILMFCANADFLETKAEVEFIKDHIHTDCYQKMHAELESNNDYQSIQKITHAMDRFEYTPEDRIALFEEIKALFLSDGEFDLMEKNLLMGLKHILK